MVRACAISNDVHYTLYALQYHYISNVQYSINPRGNYALPSTVLSILYCLLSLKYMPPHGIPCTLYAVQCTVYSVQCVLYLGALIDAALNFRSFLRRGK